MQKQASELQRRNSRKSMQISRNQAVFASVAVIGVCLTAIFVLRSKTSFLNAFKLAFSSPEKRKALRKLQRIAEVISELSENFVEFAAAHQSLFSELSREKRPENAASSASSQNVSSYYHFDSSGNKFPSKWDSFDVEEELKRLDEEEQATDKSRAQLGAARKTIGQLNADVNTVLEHLDQVRGDEEVKQMRKMLAQEALSLSGEIDTWIEVLKE